MFSLFIFDMGGVVSHNSHAFAEGSAHLEFDGAKIIDFAKDDFKELTTGRISVGEFAQRFSKNSGQVMEEDLLTRFFSPKLDPDVVAIIDGLKNQARVVAGTNTIAPHYGIHEQRGDYGIFDAVYASHLMGLAKPDPAFYSYILDKEGYSPKQTVFIDDLPANVEAAQSLGIPSLLFTDAVRLNNDLSTLGQSK
jgi:putative hydrolase of the HAD superfamily